MCLIIKKIASIILRLQKYLIPFSAEPGRSPNFWFYNFFLPLKNRTCLFINPFSPHVGRTKTDLDSGFHAVDSGFQVLDSSSCKGNLDSGFQSELVGFRNPGAAFRIPKPRIIDSFHKQKFRGFWSPDSWSYIGRPLLSASKRPNNANTALPWSPILNIYATFPR